MRHTMMHIMRCGDGYNYILLSAVYLLTYSTCTLYAINLLIAIYIFDQLSDCLMCAWNNLTAASANFSPHYWF